MSNDRKPLGRVQLQPRAVRAEPAPLAVEPPASRSERLGPPVPRADPPRALSFTDLPATPGPAQFDLGRLRVELAALKLVPRVVAFAHKLLPLREAATELEVVMVNPENRKAVDELEFVTGKSVRVHVAPEAELVVHIRNAYDAMERGEAQYAPAPAPKPDPAPAPASARVAPTLPVVEAAPPPRARRATPPPQNAQPAQRTRSRTPPPRRASSSATRAEKATVKPGAPPAPRRTPPPRRAVRDSRSDDD